MQIISFYIPDIVHNAYKARQVFRRIFVWRSFGHKVYIIACSADDEFIIARLNIFRNGERLPVALVAGEIRLQRRRYRYYLAGFDGCVGDLKTPYMRYRRLVEELDFNSNIGAGKWVISLSISSNKNNGYKVSSTYKFSTNWVADKACQQVAQAFVPAVQQLILKTISDPRFKALSQ